MTSPQVGMLERTASGAPKLRRPLHEGFPVKDAEASLKFYTEVLGLKVLPRPNIGPGYWVGTEDKRVEFHIIETDSQYIPGPDAQPAAQARHTAWMVDSLEELRRHLDGLGVPLPRTEGPRRRGPGVYRGSRRPHLGISGAVSAIPGVS